MEIVGTQLDVHCKIRDNLHGSVAISPLEHAVIAHPALQRLRRIRQTSFLYLAFPGASHSRFEHSLGVLHLATLTWQKLYDNQIQLAQNLSSTNGYQQDGQGQLLRPLAVLDAIFRSSYIAQTWRLAALMHDVGHPPFSHSGELLLPELTKVLGHNPDLPPYLRKFLLERIRQQQKVNHEVFTVLLIDKILREVEQQTINPQDVVSIICGDIEPCADSEIARYGINSLGRELLSSDLDIDRMDYLLRDSKECGVTYGVFDFSRILDSLVLYWSDDEIHVGLKFSGLAAYEDYLQARLLMYTQIYFHKTPVAAEAMFHNLARKISYTIPSNLDRFIRLDEYNILSDLNRACDDEPQQMLDDLFYRRNLWKRVFEVTEKDGDRQRLISEFKDDLEQRAEEFAFVSYCRGLVRQTDGQDSPLKIIKKNHKQIPQIEAIENYCRFYRDRPTIELHRCYTKNGES